METRLGTEATEEEVPPGSHSHQDAPQPITAAAQRGETAKRCCAPLDFEPLYKQFYTHIFVLIFQCYYFNNYLKQKNFATFGKLEPSATNNQSRNIVSSVIVLMYKLGKPAVSADINKVTK